MNKNEMDFYKKIYDICDEIYKFEAKIKQSDIKKSEYNFCYLIEKSIFDEFKTNINYYELKKCVEDKMVYTNFNGAKKFIEKKLKYYKKKLPKIENNKIEQFKNSKELIDKLSIENKEYNLINYGLKTLISKSKEEDKKIQFYIKGKILHLLFDENDIIQFNFNKYIIEKSALLEQDENKILVNKKNKIEDKESVLYEKFIKDIKTKYKKNIEILIRYYFYDKEIKKKNNDSFLDMVENKKETVYLINNEWIENYKNTFDYNILKNTIIEYEKENTILTLTDEKLEKIFSSLSFEYFNKIHFSQNSLTKNIDMILSKNEKIKFLFNFQIINSQIYGLLMQLEYNCNIIEKLDLYYIGHNKILLKFPNEISKNCDEIGFINEQNIFIPEYILFYENEIGIQNLNLFFKNNFFVNSNNKDFEIFDDKKKIIGHCYSLSSFNENNENSTNDNNSENIDTINQNEIQGNDNTNELTDNKSDNNINNKNPSNNIEEQDALQSQENISEINQIKEEISPKNKIKKEQKREIQDKIKLMLLLYKFNKEVDNKIKESTKIEEYRIEEGFIIKKELIDEFKKLFLTEDIENYLKSSKLNDEVVDIEYIYSYLDKKNYLEKINEENNIINQELCEYLNVKDNNEDIFYPKNFYIINRDIFLEINKNEIPDKFDKNKYEIKYIINDGKIILSYQYFVSKDKIYYYILICEKNENSQYDTQVIFYFENNKEKRDREFSKYTKDKFHLNNIENDSVIGEGIVLKRPLEEEKYINKYKQILIKLFIEINLFKNIFKEKIAKNIQENNDELYCYIINKNWMSQFLDFFQYSQFIQIIKNIDFENSDGFKSRSDDIIESLKNEKIINDKIKQKNTFVNTDYNINFNKKIIGEESISYYDDFMIINEEIKNLIFDLLKIEIKEKRKILIKDNKIFIKINENSILIGRIDEKFIYHTEIFVEFIDNYIEHFLQGCQKEDFNEVLKRWKKFKNNKDIFEIRDSNLDEIGKAYLINFDMSKIFPKEEKNFNIKKNKSKNKTKINEEKEKFKENLLKTSIKIHSELKKDSQNKSQRFHFKINNFEFENGIMKNNKLKLENSKENDIKILILYYISNLIFEEYIRQNKIEETKDNYYIINHDFMELYKNTFKYGELSENIDNILREVNPNLGQTHIENLIFSKLDKSYLETIRDININIFQNKTRIRPTLIIIKDNSNVKYPHKFEIINSKIYNQIISTQGNNFSILSKVKIDIIKEGIIVLYENKNLNIDNILLGNIDFSSNEFIPQNILNYFSSEIMIKHFVKLKNYGWKNYLEKNSYKNGIIDKNEHSYCVIGEIYYLNKREETHEYISGEQNKEKKENEEEEKKEQNEIKANIINEEQYIQIEGINKNHLKLLFGIKFFHQNLKEKINNNMISKKKNVV